MAAPQVHKRLTLARYHDAGQAPGTVLVGVGYLVNKPADADVHDRLWPFWGTVVLLTEGRGRFTQDGVVHPVQAGDLFITFPGRRHSYHRQEPGIWSEYHVILQGDTFAELQAAGLIDPARPVLHLGLGAPAVAALRSLVSAFLFDGTLPPERSLAAIVRVLVEAGRRRSARPVGSFATQACRLLAGDPQRQQPLTEFARQMQLSPDRFRRRFTAEVGMSPARYRLWCSIQEAQRLLAEEDLPIKAVARRLGFSSPSHLARCFAKLTGSSPAAWRRQGAPVRMPELTGSTN